jgi:competence protein ComEC
MQLFLIVSLTLVTILIPSYQLRESPKRRQFIVWNIGQGQWTTWVKENECWHFDVGGEKDASRGVESFCSKKLNRIFLSHWDWDHVGLLARLKKTGLKLCLAAAPQGPTSDRKKMLIHDLRSCPAVPVENYADKVVKLFSPSQKSLKRPIGGNHLSQVFWLSELNILIPGDSTTTEEKIWKGKIPISTRGLILGHHGSRSSTSNEVLENLPHLRWAVSSARKSRYGHPHSEVIERLAKRKIPLLRTEDWGTLHFFAN